MLPRCLGAALSATADEPGLKEAYGAFQKEALTVEPDYQPQTVNADGWSATRLAWEALFTGIVVLRCFLHGWLNIRKRGKHLKDTFWQVGELAGSLSNISAVLKITTHRFSAGAPGGTRKQGRCHRRNFCFVPYHPIPGSIARSVLTRTATPWTRSESQNRPTPRHRAKNRP
jgi:hypothetical protein